MLQPLQLRDVSVHYAEEIAELRAFLVDAGFAGGTAAALGELAARLPHDRSFRRDLTSHLWVLIDKSNLRISHAGMLGVLAVSAAGTRFAAEAEEEIAHSLLRFVMAARRSFDLEVEQGATSAVREPEVQSSASFAHESAVLPSADPSHVTVGAEPVELHGAALPLNSLPLHWQASQPSGRKRGPATWIAAACVLAALAIGLWLHRRQSADLRRAAETVAVRGPVITVPVPTASSDGMANTHDVDGTATGAVPPAIVPTYSRSAPLRPVAPRSRPMRKSARSEAARVTSNHSTAAPGRHVVNVPEAASTLPPAALSPNTTSTVARATAPSTLLPSSRNQHAAPAPNAGVSAIPASTLSQRLGSQSLPAYASANDETADMQHHPRLLRRRTGSLSSASSAGNANLVAGVDPEEAPAMPGKPSAASSGASRSGTVRPISLGRMAANVLYSPSPEYPAAASAAHVQGEVKVQAEVGRDGSVIAARIVSGPPLLRDAALDAVQHWRYRPYVSSGKPVPMSAMAVMDFQLP